MSNAGNLIPVRRSIDPSVEGRRAGILISHAAAPPTPRAYQSASTLTGITLRAATIAAAVLVTCPSPSRIASAAGEQLKNIQPVATAEPVALYITLCLWSQQRPATCRKLPLTPGAAGPAFASMEACQDGQDEAFGKWRAQAGPVFGFTAMAGDGYRIEEVHCGPVVGSSSHGS
jgi:hypothetical protein